MGAYAVSYEIYIIDKNFEKKQKIKDVVNINWGDDLDNIFTAFDFTTSEVLKAGEWIEIFEKDENKTVLRGIITKTSQSQKALYTYSGYDTGFYCEKNKITIQYKTNTKISEGIKQALKEVEIPCKNIPDIIYTVKKIYKNTLVTDILKELLQFAVDKGLQNNLFYDCKQGYVSLNKYSENDNLKGVIANIYTIKSTDTIHGFNITSSIENMKNRVQVITSESDKGNITKVKKEYTTQNNDNVEKYGVLQETIEPQKDEKNYKKLAELKLKELNKIEEKTSLTILANYKAKKGVIIPIKNDYLKLNDKYLIKSSKHAIEGTKEIVTIEIEKYVNP